MLYWPAVVISAVVLVMSSVEEITWFIVTIIDCIRECGFHVSLTQLRKEKIDLENHLEAEQEQFVNRLWKRMEQLENEKR